jgi:phosphatidylserine decarboxylase
MKLHHEGMTYILVSLALFVGATVTMVMFFDYTWPTFLVSAFFLFFLIVFLQFFRKPFRQATKDDHKIISPCDGKVVVIEKVFEPEYLKAEVMQVSIFMSPVNVHINWYPTDGVVEYVKYHPGKYLVAWHPKSSTENERSTVVIKRRDGKKVLVRQIAGILARKICNYAKVNMITKQGSELGFIKFGSRVDLFLPLDAKILVQLEQKVTGSIDAIAELS